MEPPRTKKSLFSFNLSTLILRISLGLVFLFFGLGKFKGDAYAKTTKSLQIVKSLPILPDTTVLLIGSLEILIAILLLLGLYTRLASLLASLHLISILSIFGLTNIDILRDIGLLGAAISLFLTGSEFFCLDNLLKKNKSLQKPIQPINNLRR